MHIPQAILPIALAAYSTITRTLDVQLARPTGAVSILGDTTAVDEFNDNQCASYKDTFLISNPGHSGSCNQVDGTKSIKVTGLQDGCSGM
jgi:hypothetical protein